MTTGWTLTLIGLTVAVGVLALYSLGAGRAVLRALTDRPNDVVFAPSGLDSSGPPIGQVAPSLSNTDGVTPFSTARKRLVLFAEVGCQPCVVLASDLTRRSVKTGDIELVAVVDDPLFGERFRDEWTVIVDPTYQLTASWGITSTPHVTVLDHNGRVRHNAVVNTRKEVQRLANANTAH